MHTLTGTDGYPLPDTDVPDDGDDADAASVEVPFQALEDKVATALGRVGGPDGTAEWTQHTPQARLTTISPVLMRAASTYVIPAGASTAVGLQSRWSLHYLNAAGTGPGGRDVLTQTGKMYTSLPFHQGILELGGHTPTAGDVITAVYIGIDPGSAQATTTDRMAWSLVKRTSSGTQTSVASGTSDNTANAQTVSATGLTETVGSGDSYSLHITSSTGATGGTEDFVTSVILGWNQVRPTRRS